MSTSSSDATDSRDNTRMSTSFNIATFNAFAAATLALTAVASFQYKNTTTLLCPATRVSVYNILQRFSCDT